MFLNRATQVILMCVLTFSSYYAQDCTTPDGGKGVCKDINKCPLLSTLRDPARKNDEKVCGDRNKVCCNDCYTPDGKAGLCVSPQNCPHLLSLLNSDRQYYVWNSICSSKEIQVCCGPPPSPVLEGNCGNRITAFPPDPTSGCCGIDSILDGKIIGGVDTQIDEYPWLALLEYQVGNEIELKCGGALISGKYVITAAHCVKGRVTRGLTSVRLGEYDTENAGKDCVGFDCTYDPISMPIEEIIPHPEYNATTNWNDIALLRLKDHVNFTDFVRPICLPWSDITAEVPLSSLKAYTAGWGQTDRRHPSSRIKQHVDLPVVDTRACHRAHSLRSYLMAPLWSKQLCAGGVRGKDSCKGDSGGPLMIERKVPGSTKLAHEITGVVSFGPFICGTEFLPGIYTKVSEYNAWIRSLIRP